ncbi:hypothetical protein SAMN05444266_107498 [Chitinophaga jiangningensis]|uniref:Uncharacterized protein n=1 Tax=Chitinophaga jiangningensis TaxID=1419482 RepID=A0A1M7I4E7_9BACT|nr:hypothetical protein [Chitinophaga jiangningensis]SHM35433.1 hypothetical protein SAMN05444266_107498 [Chitinophaga jiangningensis]
MRHIPLIALVALLAACDGKSAKEKKLAADFHFTENALYNEDSVKLASKVLDDNKTAAEKKFLEAVDVYRNKKQYLEGVGLFKASILLQPQAKTYYELGNALLDAEKNQEAIDAYSMAEALNYKPLHKLLYNKACAYSKSDSADQSLEHLVAAIEFGYTNMDNIMKDPDLANVRKSYYSFNGRIHDAFSGIGDADKLQWNMFLRDFKPMELPVTFDKTFITNKELTDIPYDYERYVSEMRNAKFERETGSLYYYVGLIRKDTSFKTLCYAVDEKALEDYKWPYYLLVSYDNKGKLIDKLFVGGQKLDEDPYRVGEVNGNGEITVTDFQITYEKPVSETRFDENKEVESKELKKEFYTIAADGHFVKKSNEPLALR